MGGRGKRMGGMGKRMGGRGKRREGTMYIHITVHIQHSSVVQSAIVHTCLSWTTNSTHAPTHISASQPGVSSLLWKKICGGGGEGR